MRPIMRHADAFRRATLAAAALLALAAARPAAAQDQSRSRQLFDKISWADGPVKGELGDVAEVQVPASCRFTGAEGAKHFMEATENPTSGSELGILLCQPARVDASPWFVVFSFEKSGYIKDDEKDKLDADAILTTLKRGNEAGNRERKRRGWETIDLVGWERAPFYDPSTHNLTWSTRLKSGDAQGDDAQTINHSVRLLGRRGVMHADLVLSPADLGTAVPSFDRMVAGFSFSPGQRYAEWRSGDKVAEYGLTALIAGGAGAAAAKLGLFGKLWKLIIGIVLALKKLVVLVIVGIVGFFKKLFGKGGDEKPAAKSPAPSGDGVRAPINAYRTPVHPRPLPTSGGTGGGETAA